MLTIRPDDLSGEPTRALLALHLAGMHETSPAGHVFALDLSGLQTADVTVWTAWHGDSIAGVGALRMLGDGGAEIKSMRTHPDHLRQGVAAALLDHIVAAAKRGGWTGSISKPGVARRSTPRSRSIASGASPTASPLPTISGATSTSS